MGQKQGVKNKPSQTKNKHRCIQLGLSNLWELREVRTRLQPAQQEHLHLHARADESKVRQRLRPIDRLLRYPLIRANKLQVFAEVVEAGLPHRFCHQRVDIQNNSIREGKNFEPAQGVQDCVNNSNYRAEIRVFLYYSNDSVTAPATR